MQRIWRVARWLVMIGVVLFASAQLIRPAKTNPVSDRSLALESQMQVKPDVAAILDRACADCHSNKTRWPWYSHVAPVSWFVIDHVNHGRSHLNFSEWGSYDKSKQRKLLEGTCELVREGGMPLTSYMPLHPEAKLTEKDKKAICDWTQTAQN